MKITTEEMRKKFIEDGWNEDTSFAELTLEEAKEKGYSFAVVGINKGQQYFKMNGNGNIYDGNGKIVYFYIPVKTQLKEERGTPMNKKYMLITVSNLFSVHIATETFEKKEDAFKKMKSELAKKVDNEETMAMLSDGIEFTDATLEENSAHVYTDYGKI